MVDAGHDEVRARVRIEPALRFEEAMLAFRGACADGHTNAEGRPTPLLGALAATRYRSEIRYRQPPDAVQRLPSRCSRRSPGGGAWSGPSIATSISPRTRQANLSSVAFPSV